MTNLLVIKFKLSDATQLKFNSICLNCNHNKKHLLESLNFVVFFPLGSFVAFLKHIYNSKFNVIIDLSKVNLQVQNVLICMDSYSCT